MTKADALKAIDTARYRKTYRANIDRFADSGSNLVVSYPKSGRTWHRAMVGTYMGLLAGGDQADAFDLEGLCKIHNVEPLHYTHGCANFVDGLTVEDELFASPLIWRGNRVLLIVRDVRDVLVSAWHHAVFRDGITADSIHDFIRSPTMGAIKALAAAAAWDESKNLTSHFSVVTFEEMHRDPGGALKSALEFFKFPRIVEDKISEAVIYCQFDAMRAREDEGFYKSSAARARQKDERAKKFRRGEMGRFGDYLSEADIKYIADVKRRIERQA